jgi:hypothetical protein
MTEGGPKGDAGNGHFRSQAPHPPSDRRPPGEDSRGDGVVRPQEGQVGVFAALEGAFVVGAATDLRGNEAILPGALPPAGELRL